MQSVSVDAAKGSASVRVLMAETVVAHTGEADSIPKTLKCV